MTARELIEHLIKTKDLDREVLIQVNLPDGYYTHKEISYVFPNGHIGYGGPIIFMVTRKEVEEENTK